MTDRRIAARSLVGVTVRFADRAHDGAALFPFFDRGGRVKRFMLVYDGSSKIHDLRAVPGAVERRWWGLEIAEPPPVLQAAAGDLATLWHYDPWWLLRHPRFRDHPALPALQATNVVDHLPGRVLGAHYTADLSELGWLRRLDRRPPWLHLDPLAPNDLPPLPGATSSLRERRAWRLRPSWRRALRH